MSHSIKLHLLKWKKCIMFWDYINKIISRSS